MFVYCMEKSVLVILFLVASFTFGGCVHACASVHGCHGMDCIGTKIDQCFGNQSMIELAQEASMYEDVV